MDKFYPPIIRGIFHSVGEVSTFCCDVLTTIYSIFCKKKTLYIIFFEIKCCLLSSGSRVRVPDGVPKKRALLKRPFFLFKSRDFALWRKASMKTGRI